MLTLPGPEKATLQAVGARSVELSSPAAGSVLVIEGACPPSGGHATQLGMSYRTGSTTTSGACPAFLVHNWPPAFKEWSTKVVRNAVFVSSLFPRLLRPYVLKDTTVRGVSQGVLAYAGIGPDGHYQPFYYVNAPGRTDLTSREVDLPSDDMFIIPAETARAYIKELERPEPVGTGDDPPPEPVVDPKPITGPRPPITPDPDSGESKDDDGSTPPNITPGKVRLAWTGNLPYQKWSLFYMKLLTKLAQTGALELDVTVRAATDGERAQHLVEELRTALRELGLDDQIEVRPE